MWGETSQSCRYAPLNLLLQNKCKLSFDLSWIRRFQILNLELERNKTLLSAQMNGGFCFLLLHWLRICKENSVNLYGERDSKRRSFCVVFVNLKLWLALALIRVWFPLYLISNGPLQSYGARGLVICEIGMKMQFGALWNFMIFTCAWGVIVKCFAPHGPIIQYWIMGPCEAKQLIHTPHCTCGYEEFP